MANSLQKLAFVGVVMIAVVNVRGRFGASETTTGAALPGDPSNQGLEAPLSGSGPAALYESLDFGIASRGAVRSSGAIRRHVFFQVADRKPPEIRAASALLGDLLSGELYFTREPSVRWPMASLTKLVSAAVAADRLSLNASTTLLESDFSPTATSTRLASGERYAVHDLLRAMLVVSSNEAAEALSRLVGRREFIEAMNEKAKLWEAPETFFDDPTGLSAANQSTAGDLLKIASHLFQEHPEIFAISKQPDAGILDREGDRLKTIKNINVFAGEPEFLGGKTGFTDEALGNLLSVFAVHGRPVLVVVLGTVDRFGETGELIDWFRETYERVQNEETIPEQEQKRP